MGNFASYQDILPDPNNKISLSGDSAGTASGTIGEGKLGPGFATLKFTANQPVMMSRTNSGRVITRSVAAHSWNIDISYNPMTREEFEPIFSFLMSRNGKLNPFFVELPQYLTSRNSGFHTQTSGGTLLTMSESSTIPAGRTYFRTSWAGTATNLPSVGDIFTITDPNNSNHTKVYMTTRVETAGDFNTTLDSNTDPTLSPFRVRVHFSPPLVTSVSTTSTLDYVEPRIRVIQKTDIQEYSLGVNGLYSFGLKVEEAAP